MRPSLNRYARARGSATGDNPPAPNPVLKRGEAGGFSDLVAVVVRLERAGLRHANIVRLLVRKLGQLDAQLFEVERSDLFVEVLGQDVDVVFVFVRLGEQLDLREGLVGDARALLYYMV